MQYMINNYNRQEKYLYKYNKKLIQIRKASNIDITKLQIIVTKVTKIYYKCKI